MQEVKSSQQATPKPLQEVQSRVFEGDRTLWIIFTVLIVTSILVVYSSTAKMTYEVASNMSLFDALQKQVMYVMGAVFAIFITHKIGHHRIFRWSHLIYFAALAATIATYIVGEKTNDAARWLNLGFFRFQPSETLKIATILLLARVMDQRHKTINTLNILPTSFKFRSKEQLDIIRNNTIPLLGPVVVACAVILPAHTSSALIVFIASLTMLYIGRVRIKEILKFVALISLFGVLGIGLMRATETGRTGVAKGRVEQWYDYWFGDTTATNISEISDTQRALIAIHNGGLVGEGAGQSTSRVLVIHPESDYAYAFFVSEYGIILGLILMLLYIWMFFRAMDISQRCTTAFPMLMALGLGLLITGQAILHILVQTYILPETGQPLPFISRGGSSLIFTSIALGLIIGVSRSNEQKMRA
ncbi:MAG: FtsW/RodA/SpoVE family cell cycle protein [Alistipes sp.]|nr:FtsW/RodA/SpoVE family cell cycle protein [Alistipes sp.]